MIKKGARARPSFQEQRGSEELLLQPVLAHGGTRPLRLLVEVVLRRVVMIRDALLDDERGRMQRLLRLLLLMETRLQKVGQMHLKRMAVCVLLLLRRQLLGKLKILRRGVR